MRGYGVPDAPLGLRSWAWARKRFNASHNYWVTTVRPDGRPSSSAVWGMWLHGAFWFSCAANSRKALNLARNPACTVTTEQADEAVILEGTAAPVRGRSNLLDFVRAYKKKYNWDMNPDAEGYFIVTPHVGFAFVEHAGQFAKTATRYEFDVSRRPTKKASTKRR
jgi:hypothetical protein